MQTRPLFRCALSAAAILFVAKAGAQQPPPTEAAAMAPAPVAAAPAPVAPDPDLERVQAELARLLAATTPEPAPLAGGWRPGAGKAASAQLRAKLADWGYRVEHAGGHELAETLKRFQRTYGIGETGTVDAATRTRLNLSRTARIARLQQRVADQTAAPVDRTGKLIVVNIPAYELRAYDAGRVVIDSRVVVGRPKRPTPDLAVAMRAIKYNPTWTPPPTIVKQDLIPLLGRDPARIRRLGLVILNARGHQIAPEGLGAMSAEGFRRAGYKLFQPAGDRNALGKLKFEITNTPSIYLHDTNHRSDFRKANRALSSGCVRVEEYRPLAAWILGRDEEAVQARIDKGKTVYDATEAIPVHMVYWLADVRAGQIVYYDDVYQRLGTDEPAAAPATLARRAPAEATPPVAAAPRHALDPEMRRAVAPAAWVGGTWPPSLGAAASN